MIRANQLISPKIVRQRHPFLQASRQAFPRLDTLRDSSTTVQAIRAKTTTPTTISIAPNLCTLCIRPYRGQRWGYAEYAYPALPSVSRAVECCQEGAGAYPGRRSQGSTLAPVSDIQDGVRGKAGRRDRATGASYPLRAVYSGLRSLKSCVPNSGRDILEGPPRAIRPGAPLDSSWRRHTLTSLSLGVECEGECDTGSCQTFTRFTVNTTRWTTGESNPSALGPSPASGDSAWPHRPINGSYANTWGPLSFIYIQTAPFKPNTFALQYVLQGRVRVCFFVSSVRFHALSCQGDSLRLTDTRRFLNDFEDSVRGSSRFRRYSRAAPSFALMGRSNSRGCGLHLWDHRSIALYPELSSPDSQPSLPFSFNIRKELVNNFDGNIFAVNHKKPKVIIDRVSYSGFLANQPLLSSQMKEPDKTKPGPKMEHLKIKGDWTKAVKKGLVAPPPTKKPPKPKKT